MKQKTWKRKNASPDSRSSTTSLSGKTPDVSKPRKTARPTKCQWPTGSVFYKRRQGLLAIPSNRALKTPGMPDQAAQGRGAESVKAYLFALNSAGNAIAGAFSLAGDSKTGKVIGDLIGTTTNSVERIYQAGELMKTPGRELAGNAAMAFSVVGAFVAISNVVAGIGSPSTDEIILEKLAEIQNQLRAFERDANRRFDRLDRMLIDIYTAMMMEFQTSHQLSNDIRKRLDEVLVSTHGLSEKIDALSQQIDSYFAREDKKKEAATARACFNRHALFLHPNAG